MGMTPKLHSISSLSVETGINRRTLAKRLAQIPPAEVRGRVKRWFLKDVLKVLKASSAPARFGERDVDLRERR